jgi:gentisate 1,2-dioxygenase
VLTSEKPWADLDKLDEAYIMYLSYSKILDALQKAGSSVMFYREASRRISEISTPA